MMISDIPDVSMEDVIANSFRDFHVKGFDYICLRRSQIETVKLYFFDGDVSKLPEVVNPHDHRYNFDTLCIAGAVENISYRRDGHGDAFHRFEYLTPLNGGSGFSYAESDLLRVADRCLYRPGQLYRLGFKHIHTIRMAENETVIALRQFEDRVPTGRPTSTWSRDREPPSLDGLYNKFSADQIRKRLAMLRERVPLLKLPRVI
jgi:hypothetical protein